MPSQFIIVENFFVPKMKKIKKGVILNVASTAGLSPRPKLNWYNASKGWMITATKAMAIELAPYKVRVNAIAPVAGITPLLKSFMGGNTPKKTSFFINNSNRKIFYTSRYGKCCMFFMF